MTPDQAQRSQDLVEGLKDWRHGPADQGTSQNPVSKFLGMSPKPGQTGAIADADKINSLLHTVNNANLEMPYGALIGNAGVQATRASLGGGIGHLTGMGIPAGSALGVTLMNPQLLSLLGFLGADALRAAPAAMRGMDTYNTIVKRRDFK